MDCAHQKLLVTALTSSARFSGEASAGSAVMMDVALLSRASQGLVGLVTESNPPQSNLCNPGVKQYVPAGCRWNPAEGWFGEEGRA